MAIMIPALAAAGFLDQRRAAEEDRRRQLAAMAAPDAMPSRQPRGPSYAEAVNVAGALGGGQEQRPAPAAGARQAQGSMQPNAQALANAAPSAAFQRSNPYAAPTAGTATPPVRPMSPGGAAMARPPMGADQMQLQMAAQNQVGRAMAPAAPRPRQEDSTGSDAAALGLALGGQALGRQQQSDAIRRQALTGIASQQARSLGAPTYGLQAAQARRDMSESQGMNYLQPLLEYYRSRGQR